MIHMHSSSNEEAFLDNTVESRISKLLNSKKPSLVNKILCWPGSLYTINHMLNSKTKHNSEKTLISKQDFMLVRIALHHKLHAE